MTKPNESECCGAVIVNVGGILGLLARIFDKNFDKQVDVFVCDDCSKVIELKCHRPEKEES